MKIQDFFRKMMQAFDCPSIVENDPPEKTKKRRMK